VWKGQGWVKGLGRSRRWKRCVGRGDVGSGLGRNTPHRGLVSAIARFGSVVVVGIRHAGHGSRHPQRVRDSL
jgi:hypothetical protein